MDINVQSQSFTIAESQLVKIQKNIQIKIVEFIDNLEVTYYPNKYDISKLKGRKNTYRIRIANYRIFYYVDSQIKRLLFFIFV